MAFTPRNPRVGRSRAIASSLLGRGRGTPVRDNGPSRVLATGGDRAPWRTPLPQPHKRLHRLDHGRAGAPAPGTARPVASRAGERLQQPGRRLHPSPLEHLRAQERLEPSGLDRQRGGRSGLNRRRAREQQRRVLAHLVAAGPEGVWTGELRRRAGYDDSTSMSGVFKAIGGRFRSTGLRPVWNGGEKDPQKGRCLRVFDDNARALFLSVIKARHLPSGPTPASNSTGGSPPASRPQRRPREIRR